MAPPLSTSREGLGSTNKKPQPIGQGLSIILIKA